MEKEIVIFENRNIKLEVPYTKEQETVWLTSNQIAELFERDEKPLESILIIFFRMMDLIKLTTILHCISYE